MNKTAPKQTQTGLSKKNTGIVYILNNGSMPNMIKIGRTDNLKQRLNGLDTTGVPLPFECYFAAKVDDADKIETLLHNVFAPERVRKNREFFFMEDEGVRVKILLQHLMLKDVTPKNQDTGSTPEEKQINKKAIYEARKKKPKFSFDMVKISNGETLYSVFDPDITCTVYDNTHVKFEGEITSLSKSATDIRDRKEDRDPSDSYTLQGPKFWKIEDGKTLSDLREEFN